MESIQKPPLYEVALNLSPNELNSLCRTNKRFAEICNSEYFWLEKRIRDFDLKEFLDQTDYSNKEKYKILYFRWKQSGSLYGWGANHNGLLTNPDVNLIEQPINILPNVSSIFKVISYGESWTSRGYGIYILTYDCNLFVLGYNTYTDEISNKPVFLMNNVFDIFISNDEDLYILDFNYNIIEYKNKQTIWSTKNARKLIFGVHSNNMYVITLKNQLYMFSERKWKNIKNTRSDILDFVECGMNSYYLFDNNELQIHNDYDGKHYFKRDIFSVSCNISGRYYIDTNKILWNSNDIKIDDNVIKFVTANSENEFMYSKSDGKIILTYTGNIINQDLVPEDYYVYNIANAKAILHIARLRDLFLAIVKE